MKTEGAMDRPPASQPTWNHRRKRWSTAAHGAPHLPNFLDCNDLDSASSQRPAAFTARASTVSYRKTQKLPPCLRLCNREHHKLPALSLDQRTVEFTRRGQSRRGCVGSSEATTSWVMGPDGPCGVGWKTGESALRRTPCDENVLCNVGAW